MDAMNAALALLAGIFSTLSPCVLPILPLVLGAAATEHRLAPVALAGGLALSLTAIGLFVATIGFALGLDTALFRGVAAAAMVGLGMVLLLPALQVRLATAAGPVGGWVESRYGGLSTSGVRGQFALGLLLGAVWAPCVGPTLGAASLLAAQGRDLASVALVMAVFGIGAALPLLALGALSRNAVLRLRSRLLRSGQRGRMLMGAVFVSLGMLILSGVDKRLEAVLVEASPAWLTELTTRF